MGFKQFFRNAAGQIIGSSEDDGTGRTNYFNSNEQSVGFTNDSGTFNADGQIVSPDDVGRGLLDQE